ncbi:MAG: ester cyclase [Pseudomonadota bacterium]
MTSIAEIAHAFFEACETGKGWDQCKQYCNADATFSAQSEAIGEITTLADYTEWMKGLVTGPIPDGNYELKSFAVDGGRNNVCAYGVFKGTHTGDGGPIPATGKAASSDYVYVMEFDGDKVSHMTKIWHSGVALQQLGWA